MTFSKQRYSVVQFRLSLVDIGQGVVKIFCKSKSMSKDSGILDVND